MRPPIFLIALNGMQNMEYICLRMQHFEILIICLLYTSDAADE